MTPTTGNGEPLNPMLGQLLDGRYELTEKLGEGGIGEVYLARDTKMMHRVVVVKVLLENWIANPEIRRKFEHEKEALSRLDHPAIVGILDAGFINGQKPYFVMPLAPGVTLEHLLREEPLPPLEMCADIIETVAEALSVAHANGILHRDVKPENIIVETGPGKRPRVRLIDFGIARVLDSKISPVTHVERSIGTVWYVAPEQLLGSIDQTPAADVFSLAVVAFLMLTGRRPFDPQTVAEMAVLHRNGLRLRPSSLNRNLSPEVDQVIIQALQYDPRKRCSTAAEFGSRLAAALRTPYVPSTNTLPDPALYAQMAIPTPSEGLPEPEEDGSIALEATWRSQPSSSVTSYTPLPPRWLRPSFLLPVGGLLLFLTTAIVVTIAFWPKKTEMANISTPTPPPTATPPSVPKSNAVLRIRFEVKAKSKRSPAADSPSTIERQVFANNDDLDIIVEANRAGNFFVLNEDYLSASQTVFHLLFPQLELNNGFSRIDGVNAETVPVRFVEEPGVEVIWIVWSAESVPALEDARVSALKTDGALNNQQKVKALKDFLDKTYSEAPATLSKDGDIITAQGNDRYVVYRVELEHR